MKKNLIISLTVIGAILLGSVTVFAGNMIAKKVTCPNCGTEVEVQSETPAKRGFGNRDFGKKFEPKTLDELKTDLAGKVAEGKLTQEQADKFISNYEKMQENAKKREEELAKRKEEYKAKLAEKVAAGELTQEQADKLLENHGKRGNMTNRGNGRHSFDFSKKAQPKTLEELKAELAEKVTKGEMTQEQADKLIAEYEARTAKFKEMSAKREETKGKAPFRGNFGGRSRGKDKAPEKSDK